MTADRDRYRALTAAAVLLVAAIAAVVSFVHIESLAIRYGQPLLAAWLLPVSIDGTVAVSSLAMLRAARLAMTAPWLARGMLLLAVAATLACNVAYGLPHGIPGALLSGWPAVAFVGCAEVAISMSRKRTAPAARPRRKRPRPKADRSPATGTEAAIRSALANGHAHASNADLAAELGVSARTVRRYRARLTTIT